MGALHLDTYWSSEEEETNEIMSISVDRYYLTLGTAVCSFPHVCAPNAVQLEEGQPSALAIRQPPPPGEWQYHHSKQQQEINVGLCGGSSSKP